MSDIASKAAEFWAANDEARFDQKTIAAVTKYSESSLEKFRGKGGGPAFIRLGGVTPKTDKNGKARVFGGKVLYRKIDVIEWMVSQATVKSTAEYPMLLVKE